MLTQQVAAQAAAAKVVRNANAEAFSALTSKYDAVWQLVLDMQAALLALEKVDEETDARVDMLENPPSTTTETSTTTTLSTTTITATTATTTTLGPPAVKGIRWYYDMSTLNGDKLRDLTEKDTSGLEKEEKSQEGKLWGNYASNHQNDAEVKGSRSHVQYLKDGGVGGSGCVRLGEQYGFYQIPANQWTLISGGRPRTISLYIKIEGSRAAHVDNGDYPFGMGTDCPSSHGYSTGTSFNMRFGPGRKLGFMGCGNDEAGRYGDPFSVDEWHHVMYTYDRSHVRVIVDGKESISWAKELHTSNAGEGRAVVQIGAHTGAGFSVSNSDITGADCLVDEFYIIDHAVDKDSEEYTVLRCHPFRVMGKECPEAG